jgi:hypothetical protein
MDNRGKIAWRLVFRKLERTGVTLLKLNKICVWIVFVIIAPVTGWPLQAGIGASSGPPPSAVPANFHPATESTLRRYFEVSHFEVRNREGLETQLEVQQKTLPLWYPADVWADTVDGVLAIDALSIAMPIYQRYFSEEGTQNAIRLFVTPAGQEMLNKMYSTAKKDEVAGDSATEARRKALDDEQTRQNEDGRKILDSMTAKDKQEVLAFSRSAEWKRMNAVSDEMYKEFNAAYLVKQKEVVHVSAVKHADELRKALRDYKATHPEYQQPKPAASN